MTEEKQEAPKQVVAYIRKSSEDNKDGEAHKQLNSIEYQRTYVQEALKKYNLELAHSPFEDDKSGYEAFIRDGFNSMLTFLKEKKGFIDGIVCTETSRLARNFADGGMVLWYMQDGIINNIYTPSKIFTNSSSDQLMVAIEFAMSKKSSDDTGARTKLGMRSKAKNMRHPARRAILGYITDGPVGAKKWVIDKTIGPLVKECFEKFATGKYSFEQISEYAYQIGIKSIDKSSLTKKLSENTWRNRLIDGQYTGIFYSDGERISGDYEPLVDLNTFYEVQNVINGNQHPQKNRINYAYTKMIKCGLCGDMLSATNKKGITYYRCSKRRSPCKENHRWPYIPEKELEASLSKELGKIEIDQETWETARAFVIELNQPKKINLREEMRVLSGKIESEKKFQIELGRRRIKGEVLETDFNKLDNDSHKKEASMLNSLVKCKNIEHELDELMYEFLDNIKYVTKQFESSLPENKREMVDIFCENLVWKDKILGWDWKKPYFILAKQPKLSSVLPRQGSNL